MNLFMPINYNLFMRNLYGSVMYPKRKVEIIANFNGILYESHAKYQISKDEVATCVELYREYRDHIARVYFDNGGRILDAHWEKWILSNKQKIKKQYPEKEIICLHITAGEWLASQVKNELYYEMYDRLSLRQQVACKMLLACSTILEEIDSTAEFCDKSRMCKETIDRYGIIEGTNSEK